MKTQQQLLIECQDNIADNFSTLAYAKILERNNCHFSYEYQNKDLKNVESFVEYFDLDLDFVSTRKANNIIDKSYYLTRLFTTNKKLFNKCIKSNILTKQTFDINDIELIDESIKDMFKFKDINFISDFDIYDEIINTNSIGIYISEDDKLTKKDIEFVQKSIIKLNKFLKKPNLFIFTKQKDFTIDTFIDYKLIDISDFREEYYFLSKCKHHILLDTKKSYSMNFWASRVYEKDSSYTVVRNYKKSKKRNIISI